MVYDRNLIAGKLFRWEGYLKDYELPEWNEIPDFGLYMEQVIDYLKKFLDYIPPELDSELSLTPSTINNYVRKKILPMPDRKRYYRRHLALLLIILTMKQCISISSISKMVPADIAEEDLKKFYCAYQEEHRKITLAFLQGVRYVAKPILEESSKKNNASDDTVNLLIDSITVCGLTKLLAEKLLMLDGKDLENGGSIEVIKRNR
ncbi:MAG: DUF1836 domain-containing protein [Lachnospiraceae bacterium]|nr:DUF1836 domain-containing protein [Lachnospiraceae bacterium]